MTEKLGSGHFGEVSKGVWTRSNKASKDVAVKMLKPNARDEDRVKFLQEAAIMGQFRHPNVVSLMGVVTIGEPVHCHRTNTYIIRHENLTIMNTQ